MLLDKVNQTIMDQNSMHIYIYICLCLLLNFAYNQKLVITTNDYIPVKGVLKSVGFTDDKAKR